MAWRSPPDDGARVAAGREPRRTSVDPETRMTHAAQRQRRPRRATTTTLWVGILLGAAALAVFINARSRPEARPSAEGARFLAYRVVNTFPHDPEAFTQGLIYRGGFLFESTGLHGRSSLRKVRLETGEVLQRQALDAEHFAEGLADWQDQLVQLTWQSNLGFVYDLKTFARQRTFSYTGEGWGLARDARRLIMSDGTSVLRFLDPSTFAEAGRLAVTEGGLAVTNLNELEVVKGRIFANVWQSDQLVIIDPESGQVTGRVDLSGLLPPSERYGTDVLNGIAYDANGDRLFVTGKLWPKLFEIRLE
jgi:glutaminyl-peptide cyclotransferase